MLLGKSREIRVLIFVTFYGNGCGHPVPGNFNHFLTVPLSFRGAFPAVRYTMNTLPDPLKTPSPRFDYLTVVVINSRIVVGACNRPSRIEQQIPPCVSVGGSLNTRCTKKGLDPFPDNRYIGRKTIVEPAISYSIHPIIQYPLTGPVYPDICFPIIVEVAYDGCIGGNTVVEPAIYGPIHPIIQYPLTGPVDPDIRFSVIVEVTNYRCIGENTEVEPAIFIPIHPIIQYPLAGPEYPDICCPVIVEVAYDGFVARMSIVDLTIYGPIHPIIQYPLTGPVIPRYPFSHHC